jgi:hypothetical protein
MSGVPQFASSPVNAAVAVAVANANRDGTGTVGTLYTAPANGARIDEIAIKASVTTTAGMVRLFLHNGTTFFLWKEVPVPAITASGTVPAFEAALSNLGLILQSGWSIRCSTQNAENFNLLVTQGGEL